LADEKQFFCFAGIDGKLVSDGPRTDIIIFQENAVQKQRQRVCLCVVYSRLCFVIVNQLLLFSVNIDEYHWLVHQPITIDFQYVRRPHLFPASIRAVPLPAAAAAGRYCVVAASAMHVSAAYHYRVSTLADSQCSPSE